MKDRAEYAVIAAMLNAGFKRKAKLKPPVHARRFAVEAAAQQRRYCNAFELWRRCRLKLCRRSRTCCGDQNVCLKQALDRVPRDVQLAARRRILRATPHNIGAPEREARQRMPRDFYE